MSDPRTVKVYGASDDLIEIEGDIRQEFNDDGPVCVAFSDGTVLAVEYSDRGFWRIQRLREGSAAYTKHEGTDEDKDYSDIVTLTGDLEWAVCGEFVKAKERP